MFSPTLGRWLQNDPIAFEAGDLNLYRFVGNSPIHFVDPSGLCGTAGMDITKKLRELSDALEIEFNKLPSGERMKLCFDMYDHNAGWDIYELYGLDRIPGKSDIFKPSAGFTPGCEDNVTINGKAYFAGHVNYFLWGRMNKMCFDLIRSAKKTTREIPHPNGESIGNFEFKYIFPDGGTYTTINRPLEMGFSLDSAIWYMRTYRRVFYNLGQLKEDGSDQRELWTRAGWNNNFEGLEASSTSCMPSKEVYTGSLTVRIGLAGGRADSSGQDKFNVSK